MQLEHDGPGERVKQSANEGSLYRSWIRRPVRARSNVSKCGASGTQVTALGEATNRRCDALDLDAKREHRMTAPNIPSSAGKPSHEKTDDRTVQFVQLRDPNNGITADVSSTAGNEVLPESVTDIVECGLQIGLFGPVGSTSQLKRRMGGG